MARLLPSKRPAARDQLGQHVPVADRGGGDLHAGRLHRLVEPVVGHHRHRDAVAGQPAGGAEVERGQGDQLVPVHDLTVAVDREHSVPVAVEGEAGVEAPVADPLDQALDVRGADASVDVPPVGLGRDRLHMSAEPAEDLGSHEASGAVGAVEQVALPGQVQLREAGVELT